MRRLAGWLFFLGLVELAGGGTIYATNLPQLPGEDDLTVFTGFLVGIALRKDLDGTDIVYLRYRDHDRLYKYLSIYPQYIEVRDRLGIYRQVDVLVERDGEPDADGALPVWGLVEHDPYREGTVVTYDDIYLEVTQTERSWQRVGLWLFAAGALAFAVGIAIRRAVPYRPRDPVA